MASACGNLWIITRGAGRLADAAWQGPTFHVKHCGPVGALEVHEG
jgi:hypothetical protein